MHKITKKISEVSPLIVNITNYVTVNDCANVELAIGASPIMSDEILEIEELVNICSALYVNIGTLNSRTIETTYKACEVANKNNVPIIFDPVGSGATKLRTEVARKIISDYKISIIKANMSEIKSLITDENSTNGVDAADADITSANNIEVNGTLAVELAKKHNCLIVATGPIDIIANSEGFLQSNSGTPYQKQITGTGCMLGATLAASYVVDNDINWIKDVVFEYGKSAEVAYGKCLNNNLGFGSFKVNLIDELGSIND